MYPKVMNHPQYQPAICVRVDGKGYPLEGEPMHPKAALFPPVQVFSEDQENQHRALGYLEAGECPGPYQPLEYPKWVGDVLVNSAEEEAALSDNVTQIRPRGRPRKVA